MTKRSHPSEPFFPFEETLPEMRAEMFGHMDESARHLFRFVSKRYYYHYAREGKRACHTHQLLELIAADGHYELFEEIEHQFDYPYPDVLSVLQTAVSRGHQDFFLRYLERPMVQQALQIQSQYLHPLLQAIGQVGGPVEVQAILRTSGLDERILRRTILSAAASSGNFRLLRATDLDWKTYLTKVDGMTKRGLLRAATTSGKVEVVEYMIDTFKLRKQLLHIHSFTTGRPLPHLSESYLRYMKSLELVPSNTTVVMSALHYMDKQLLCFVLEHLTEIPMNMDNIYSMFSTPDHLEIFEFFCNHPVFKTIQEPIGILVGSYCPEAIHFFKQRGILDGQKLSVISTTISPDVLFLLHDQVVPIAFRTLFVAVLKYDSLEFIDRLIHQAKFPLDRELFSLLHKEGSYKLVSYLYERAFFSLTDAIQETFYRKGSTLRTLYLVFRKARSRAPLVHPALESLRTLVPAQSQKVYHDLILSLIGPAH